VKFHLTNIYRKLGVSSRTEAVRRAYEHGILERPLSYVA
jgi:DNA-binding CsgD family transcriptional regulator